MVPHRPRLWLARALYRGLCAAADALDSLLSRLAGAWGYLTFVGSLGRKP